MVFYWIVLAICLVLTILLTLIKCSSRGWLSAFMLFLSSYVGLILLDSQPFYISPSLYFLFLSSVFLPGPLILGYVSHISTRSEVHLKDFTPCLLPVCFVLFADPLLGGYPLFEFADQSAYETESYIALFTTISAMAGICLLFYLARALRLIIIMKDDWSSYQSKTLPDSWYDMIYVIVVVFVANATIVASAFLNPSGADYSIGDIGFMLFVGYFIYLAVRSALRNLNILPSDENDELIVAHTRYLTAPSDSNEGLNGYYDSFLERIKKEKLYLQHNLSLSSLADQLEISPHNLTELLNKVLDKSFYEFINDLRIEYAAKALLVDEERSITEVYYESGFTTKSTFYSRFKKAYGLTPTQYRQSKTG